MIKDSGETRALTIAQPNELRAAMLREIFLGRFRQVGSIKSIQLLPTLLLAATRRFARPDRRAVESHAPLLRARFA